MSTMAKQRPKKPKDSMSSSNMNKSSLTKAGMRSSRMNATTSRKSGMGASRKSGMNSSGAGREHPVIVRDPETQLDVTPISLLEVQPSVMMDGGGNLSPRSRESSDKLDSQSSAGFSRSGWSSDGTVTPSQKGDSDSDKDEDDEKEKNEREAADTKKRHAAVGLAQDDLPKRADLRKEITVLLAETDTWFQLDIPSTCVADDAPGLDKVKAANAAYLHTQKAKINADKYADRHVQTFNIASKNKEAQATPAQTHDVGVDVTNYEIHDAIQELRQAEENSAEVDILGTHTKKKTTTTEALTSMDAATSAKGDAAKAAEGLLQSAKFKSSLMSMERIVVQNIYHQQQMMHRNMIEPPVPPVKGEKRVVMAWNKLNPDLLAVGYGEFEFTKQGDGLVLFWSLKNPEYPQKVYKTECSVTSLAFAQKSINLLAVGLYDGTVAIYDVRKEEDKPVLQSVYNGGKHSDSVWEVRWVDKGSEKAEALVSVSSDGRVTQWSMTKGLENSDLIKLKRVSTHKKAANTKNEAFISRMASGMSIDFNPKDHSIYVVGTEEGSIHRCSVSYTEQYLDSYGGHSGPVYKVVWSPFQPTAFLSCSADWSIRLWWQESESSMLTMQSSADYVSDIQWSPTVSTIFASVTGDGYVCIWDMSISTLDPIINEKILPRRPTCIRFSPNSNVVVAGDDTGRVTVYRVSGIDDTNYTHEEQVARLDRALAAKDAETGEGGAQ
eukprot:CAMPEP_0206279230 /NCGR_PEP_ID=MMETSP0047_2-20121206/37914_1 /ASSEMBLY_ACC=CAM_ASM_000192 /TAXON_ID=195065 /ORGANISM="Chroomonas mesostigmatica_cf, Strain CCMP1168" /LENGTH=721 /DNA_ID=CAMNT_0053709171 /DNA_START=20 /DNA_END=2186 /DNA_ORIENTATION=-